MRMRADRIGTRIAALQLALHHHPSADRQTHQQKADGSLDVTAHQGVHPARPYSAASAARSASSNASNAIPLCRAASASASPLPQQVSNPSRWNTGIVRASSAMVSFTVIVGSSASATSMELSPYSSECDPAFAPPRPDAYLIRRGQPLPIASERCTPMPGRRVTIVTRPRHTPTVNHPGARS